MNLMTLIVGAGLALVAAGQPAQEEAAGFVRKAFGQAMRPTHTLPAVEALLGGHTPEDGGLAAFSGRRISPQQLREALGDPTSIDHAHGFHWIYQLDDGAVIRVSMYHSDGPIYEITALDPQTRKAKKWLYFAGC